MQELEEVKGTSVFENMTIQQQQCNVLILAIDNYLEGLVHNDALDALAIGPEKNILLRQFIGLSKHRGYNLKNALQDGHDCPIALLQKHIKTKPPENSKSLDAFLLESIFANKHLFIQWFPDIINFNDPVKLDEEEQKLLHKNILGNVRN